MSMQWFDALPLWAVYLLLIVVGLLIVEGGFYLGRYWTARSRGEKQGSLDSSVGATLALLAFLLVFMIGIASNRYDTRRRLVIAEANAIGTTFLRAGYLGELQRSEVRSLLREYVAVRLDAARTGGILPARTRSEKIHAELWQQAETVARAAPESPMAALFVDAVNNVIDLHAERLIAVSNRFPSSNWLAIFAVSALTLAMMGFNDGLLDSRADRRKLIAESVLILVFAAVLLLIVDLDRPQEGLLQVNQQPLIDVQQQMQSPTP